MALALLTSMAGLSGTALAAVQAGLGAGRIDLKVLVIDDGSPGVQALMAEMDSEGVPYTAQAPTAAITPATLTNTSATTPQGRYQAIVLPNSAPAEIDATEMGFLADYERAFNVRQVNAYTYPSVGDGLVNQWSGTLDGMTANVTALGLAGPFSYLIGPVRIEDIDPAVSESYGYLATPTSPQLAGQSFDPLLTATIPGGATQGSLIGVQTDNGRQEMIVSGGYNLSQRWFQTVAHGMLTWATRGVHLGYGRNFFSVDIDDVLMPDSRWNNTDKCTPGDDFCSSPADDIRMTPADVTRLVDWQNANSFKFNLVFNGGGSVAHAEENGGVDSLATALTAPATAGGFDWINHTNTHLFLGCIQIPPTATDPWKCATTATHPTAPTSEAVLSNGVWYLNKVVIDAELQTNIAWATSHNLPNFSATELVSGEHSGLLTTPQQPVDNPFFVQSLTSNGIVYTASDASRESTQRTVSGGSTKTVPRHPTNIYYNVGTYFDEVSEYNWIYTSAADLGSGICSENPATSTCITPLANTDNTVAKASFESFIKPLEVRIALTHVLNNDPGTHYAHQSNLAEDGVLYPVVEGVLQSYRSEFAVNAPIVKPTMTQAGNQLARSAAWNGTATASGAKGSTTAYIDGAGVHVTAGSGTQVPVTVPTGSTGGSLDAEADAYAGELSRWSTGSFDIAIPDVGYGTAPAAPTAVGGVAGDSKVALSWTAPVVPVGAPAIASYIVTPYVGTTALPPVTTPTGVAPTTVAPFDVTGLTNGTAYTFTVAAKNAAGFVGVLSLPSAAVTPVGLPGTPTDVTGTAGDGQVSLSWTAPVSDGGSPLTGYEVVPYIGTTAQSPIPGGVTTAFTVTGLVNGTSYGFTVAAKNTVGTGPASAMSDTVTPLPPAGVPTAPTALAGTAGDRQVHLRWTAPTSNGGSPLTGYEVVPYIGTTAQSPIPVGVTTAFTVTGLVKRTSYRFTVAAKNAVGTGPASAMSAPVTPARRPGVPTAATAVAGNGSAQLTWKAPADNGGKPITRYVITPYAGGSAGAQVSTGGAGTSFTMTGLANGTAYTFTVAAVNEVGTGTASAPMSAVTPSTAPTVSMVKVNPLTLASSVTYRWQTTINGSAVTGFGVYVRRAAFGKSMPSTWKLLRTVTAPTTKVSLVRGETVAIAVKPVDRAGNVARLSGASTPVSLPLGVGSMVKSKGWKKVSKKTYYGSAALQSSRKGATLKLPAATRISRVALVASTGKGYGKIDIVVGGKRVRTVNLASNVTATKKILLPAAFTARSGGVVLKVRTSGKVVPIQGIAVLR